MLPSSINAKEATFRAYRALLLGLLNATERADTFCPFGIKGRMPSSVVSRSDCLCRFTPSSTSSTKLVISSLNCYTITVRLHLFCIDILLFLYF